MPEQSGSAAQVGKRHFGQRVNVDEAHSTNDERIHKSIHGNSQRLVGVEVAVVGANDGRVGHLEAFGVWLGHMSADDGVEGDWGGDARMGEGKSLLFGQDGS